MRIVQDSSPSVAGTTYSGVIVTTAIHQNSAQFDLIEPAPPGLGRSAAAARRYWRIALLVFPTLWVLGVLALTFTLGGQVQLTPLLAAAPAIACAGTGRRRCVVVGCCCALLALVPIPHEPVGLGQRTGSAVAIVIVACASYLLAQRRIRLQHTLEELWQIADVAQRVLLRPVPARIGPVATAVGYLAAASGARIGGDFYEVIETPYGLRAILGDARGNGLDAVDAAAAVLGAFREAGAVEPELTTVAVRLDAALARHATALRPAGPAGCDGEQDLRTEDFATAVLVQIPSLDRANNVDYVSYANFTDYSGTAKNADVADVVDPSGRTGRADLDVELVICGHPAPYLVRPGRARLLEPDDPAPPLGMRTLTPCPAPVSSTFVVFEPGESLVLYTDGITEARDRSDEFFPLAEVLAGMCVSEPAQITAVVRERLMAHTRGELHDDAAVLVLRRLAA